MLDLQDRAIPRHCRMFMAHPHRWALAFLGSGFGGSSVNAAESAPRQPMRLTDRLASLQGPSARQGALPSDCTADLGLARSETTVSWLPQHPSGDHVIAVTR
jgi:hypothetical protein